MSRSRKKHPFFKDHGLGKGSKRIAAARIRRIPIDSEKGEVLTAAPANYKKINRDSWDIHDYISRWGMDQAITDYYEILNETKFPSYTAYFIEKYPTVEDYLIKNWAKYYKRK